MESCLGVEQDLDKALSKFNALNDHTNTVLENLIVQVTELRNLIAQQAADSSITETQKIVVNELASRIKQAVFQMSTEHRELHATVSRVGKSIDRHFIPDYASVAPKAESFCSDTGRPIMEEAIAQHLYRQDLEDIGDRFVEQAKIDGVERTCQFSALQRCAAALMNFEPGPALEWAEPRAQDLQQTPLLFVLHRMQAFKIASEQGLGAAIEYARAHFPEHAARHELALQSAVCALAWTLQADKAPTDYHHLLDRHSLGVEASEMFLRCACQLLQLAPLSPLAAAVSAGARAIPALLEIHAKMTHTHVLAAWSHRGDHLPLEVDLGDDVGSYHSVFACPILRQQTTEQNPPMRLLCGHVISRDALNKLSLGAKLKCPYCPMEQTQSEARQIYFS